MEQYGDWFTAVVPIGRRGDTVPDYQEQIVGGELNADTGLRLHLLNKIVLAYLPYFLRNLSTRPAVSTTRCLPV